MAGAVCGLDFGAIMVMGDALDVDLELLAETLPDFESVLLNRIAGESEGDSGEDFQD